MDIIGLLGHQGVGKNFIGEKILINFLESKPTVILAFADHFKIDSISKYNLDYEKVYEKKDYETRKKLQIIGTEEGRNKYGDDIWINTMHNWLRVLYSRGIKRFIITDVRFQNEVNWIKSLNGLVVKIEAPNRYMNRVVEEAGKDIDRIKDIILHPSEKNIDEIQNYDICIKNDPEDHIENEIIKLFEYFKNHKLYL